MESLACVASFHDFTAADSLAVLIARAREIPLAVEPPAANPLRILLSVYARLRRTGRSRRTIRTA